MGLRHYLLLSVAVLLLVGSFFLPSAVAMVTDLGRLDNLIMIDSQSVGVHSTQELAKTERIALAASPNTEILSLKTGNEMGIDEAKETTSKELANFFGDGPFQFDFSEYTVVEGVAALIIDAKVPTLNMIVWEFALVDRLGNTVTVMIDDETGMILKLIYGYGDMNDYPNATESQGSLDEQFYATARSLTEAMKEYYGLLVTLADYEFSDSMAYYKAEIISGNRIIPMYGVVRATSFTMNERT